MSPWQWTFFSWLDQLCSASDWVKKTKGSRYHLEGCFCFSTNSWELTLPWFFFFPDAIPCSVHLLVEFDILCIIVERFDPRIIADTVNIDDLHLTPFVLLCHYFIALFFLAFTSSFSVVSSHLFNLVLAKNSNSIFLFFFECWIILSQI